MIKAFLQKFTIVMKIILLNLAIPLCSVIMMLYQLEFKMQSVTRTKFSKMKMLIATHQI